MDGKPKVRTRRKAETRERVLKAAARSIRTRGIAGTGVAGLMAEAGLTHGGFYAHFASKDALTAASVMAALDEAAERHRRALADLDPRAALSGWIDLYVSPRHRDDRGRGCVVAALAGEAEFAGTATRAALSEGIERMAASLADRLAAAGCDPALADDVLSEAVGAVLLSRAFGPGPRSDALLARCRATLKQRLGLAA